ncbi:group II intron maturase-specific domain-containing protein [Methanosarcina barkeri]|uniref:group II intron maturase-specific domain-containing protein n=1 Tax=Methanosarcina barkeri TaxID=2208 RepID=UPI000AF93F61|nr:group II intron maturase-specific domain-containing protein [Methanosarcina barkeri]
MNGFEFGGFYFQEIIDENGLERNIKIIPTEGSIEKVIEIIESIVSAEKSNFDDKNKNRAYNSIIKNISKVLDPWVNYYKHTDYAAGLERIEQSVNKRTKEFT